MGKESKKLVVCGLDIGSVTAKAVLLQDKQVLASAILPTGADIPQVAERVVKEVIDKAGLKRKDITSFIATGYGRISVPFAGRQVTEITCCARGARHFCPEVRMIIDMGGQDTKVIQLDNNGRVINFVLNDRCAAGTGRFLEVAAQTLGVKVTDLGDLSRKSQNPAQISSMCTVFAQSEIVSLVAKKTPIEDIVAGLHRSIASRVFALASTMGLKPECVIVGGVAKNCGVIRAIEGEAGFRMNIPPEPQFIVATGAALLGIID